MDLTYGYKKVVIDKFSNKTNFYCFENVNFLAKIKDNSNFLLFIFHGAVQVTKKERIIFRGYNFEIPETDIICFSDPLLNIYPLIDVNWFLSTKKYYFERTYKKIIKYYIELKKYKNVFFTGTSSGGYPSIHFAALFNKIALVSNCQLYLEVYGSSSKRTEFYKLLDILKKKKDEIVYKKKIIEKELTQNKPEKLIIFCNTLDYTYQKHIKPFVEFLNREKINLDLHLFTEQNIKKKSEHNILFPDGKKHIDILISTIAQHNVM